MEKFTNTQCLPLQKRSGADPWNKYTWNKKEIKLIKIKTEWLLNRNYKDLAICRTYLPYSFHIIPISHNTMLNQKGWRHLQQTKWMVLTCTCTVIGSNKIFWNSKNIINPQCTNTEHTVRTILTFSWVTFYRSWLTLDVCVLQRAWLGWFTSETKAALQLLQFPITHKLWNLIASLK